jgi:hypothetical protein
MELEQVEYFTSTFAQPTEEDRKEKHNWNL